jgi:predicted nucleic acid-binding protein
VGSLTLPPSGPVYADTQVFIYSVEKHPTYAPLLRPLWESAARGNHEVLSSELTLLEALVGPLRKGDSELAKDYENFFVLPGIRLLPVGTSILLVGARLRATFPNLRAPDAIHAATALSCASTRFLTNDVAFRRIPGLPVVILNDLLVP